MNVFLKAFLIISTLRNPLLIILDKLKIKNKVTYGTRSGIKFIARSGSTDINEGIVIFSGYEYRLDKVHNLPKHPTIVDIGAHIGLFSLYVLNTFPDSKVHLIEPLKENASMIVQNFELNNMKIADLSQFIISSANGFETLYLLENYDSASVIGKVRNKNAKSRKIRSSTLDNYFREKKLKNVDILKLDIEGLELDVLSSSKTAFKKVKYIFIEYHVSYDLNSREKLIKVLSKKGFALIDENHHVLTFVNNNLI